MTSDSAFNPARPPLNVASAHVHHRPEIQAGQNSFDIRHAPVPSTPGPTTPSADIPAHATKIEERTRKHSRSFLYINARSILATLKLTKSGLASMGALFCEKSKGIGVIPAIIGVILFGSSLLVQATIKAIIWLPLTTATALIGAAGGIVGTVLGFLSAIMARDATLIKKGAEEGFSIGDKTGWILGAVGVTLSALSIVARWPLHITAELGTWLLKKTAPQDPELQKKHAFILDVAARDAYQDMYLLWSGGAVGPWNLVVCRTREDPDGTDKFLLALAAGANLYSHSIFGNVFAEQHHYLLHREFIRGETDARADTIIADLKQRAAMASFLEPDKEGNSGLHLAAKEQNFSSFPDVSREALLFAFSLRNKEGITPLELAIEAENWEFVRATLAFVTTNKESPSELHNFLMIQNANGLTLFELLSKTTGIPPELTSKLHDIGMALQTTISKQEAEIHELEERLNGVPTPPSDADTPDTSNTDLPALVAQSESTSKKLAATRLKIWDRRAAHADSAPLFLLPNRQELARAALTVSSFESDAAGSTIPLADPGINITQLNAYLDRIQGTLPANVNDEGTLRSKQNLITRFKEQINGLSQNRAIRDQFQNVLSQRFRGQVTNVLRHITKSLLDQEAAIETAPEKTRAHLNAELLQEIKEREAAIAAAPEDEQANLEEELKTYIRNQKAKIEADVKAEKTALQSQFQADLKEVLWERLCLDLFHCHDRLATDCENLYFERLGMFERQQLPNRIRNKLFQFRRNLFNEAVSRVATDKHVAVTHRYYRAQLGAEFAIGSTELSQENMQYQGHRVKGQEERIRKEMREGLKPENIAAYIAQVIENPLDKDITSASVTLWIQENYPEFVDDFIPAGGSWNPMAIAVLLQDLNIIKWIGAEPPLRFSQQTLLPAPPAGQPLPLMHRLRIFDHYVEQADNSRNIKELSGIIIDLLNQWQDLLGAIADKDEAHLLASHHQLLKYLEDKWNHSFQDLIAQRKNIGGSDETKEKDLAILENMYRQLTFLDEQKFRELTDAHQFKGIFQELRKEKEDLKKEIDTLRQNMGLPTLQEKEEEEVTPQIATSPSMDNSSNAEGITYKGVFSPKTQKFLRGTMTFPDGETNTGTFHENSGRLAEGTRIFPNGDIETGTFYEDTEKLAAGTRTSPDGEKETGTFHKENGKLIDGTRVLPNGRTETGIFYEDTDILAEGTKKFPSGQIHTGTYHKNQRLAKGTASFPNGETMTGTFYKHNAGLAEGTKISPNGLKEEGKFDPVTKKLVKGIKTLPNGAKGDGRFDPTTERLIEGTKTFPDGTRITGTFDRNTGNLIESHQPLIDE